MVALMMTQLYKAHYLGHPGQPEDLLILVHFRRRRRRSTNTFQISGKTPEVKFFKPHD